VLVLGILLALQSPPARAGDNMRRIGSLTLIASTNADSRGFYAAAIDPTNGYAYFSSAFVYKVP
jgi:hypothetical protein